MDSERKKKRYMRLCQQIKELLNKPGDRQARMATVIAVLHHKVDYFFWTGFYTLRSGELMVGPYQGPVACQVLARNKGVCWSAVNQCQTVIVEDVHLFPDHIACDSRSRSEIVVPLFDTSGVLYGVLDVDSTAVRSFDETDREWLEKIVRMIDPPEETEL